MTRKITVNGYVALFVLILSAALVYAAWPMLQIIAPWLFGGLFLAGGLLVIGLTISILFRRAASVSDSWSTIQSNRVDLAVSRLDLQRQYFRLEAEMQMVIGQMQQLNAGLIFGERVGDVSFRSHSTGAARLAAQAMPQIEAAQAMPDLLPAISDLDNVLIVGGKGTGKTTLMQWLELMRLNQRRRTVVLDSHATPSQWQGDVIGRRRDYSGIRDAMIRLVAKMHQRYQRRDVGDEDFQPVDQFVDEFTLLPRMLKRELDFDIRDYTLPVLTEGRKVKYNCVWGIHSDRAAALGLEGAKDIIECFDAVVYLKNTDGERYALVNFGDGIDKETRYRHPGPFVINGQAAPVQTQIQRPPSIIDMPVAPDPSDIYDSDLERVVCEAYQQRGSKSAAYRAWYQAVNGEKPSSVGGAQFAGSIDPILQKYGLIG